MVGPQRGGAKGRTYETFFHQQAAAAVAVQSDGKILLGGYYELKNHHIALVRLCADGAFFDNNFLHPCPPSFATGSGVITTDFSGNDTSKESVNALKLVDGQILVAGYTTAIFGGNKSFLPKSDFRGKSCQELGAPNGVLTCSKDCAAISCPVVPPGGGDLPRGGEGPGTSPPLGGGGDGCQLDPSANMNAMALTAMFFPMLPLLIACRRRGFKRDGWR